MAIGTSVTPSSLKEKTDMNVRLHITIPGGGNFFLVSEPLHGKVSTVSDSPTNIVAYIPDTGFIGEDIFFYKLTDRQEADSSIAKVIVTVRSTQVPRTAHLLWILVSISLLVAIYYAYLDTTSKSSLDMLLPRTNVTVNTINMNTTANATVIRTSHTNTLSVPQIPRFIILWGYIGAAAYLLKVVTGYLGSREYQSSYLPFHIVRLFIGPALAVLMYFILQTGSFFGLSFDITKVPLQLLPYLYAGVAFLTGYFSRSIIETLSNIINAIFNIRVSSPSQPVS